MTNEIKTLIDELPKYDPHQIAKYSHERAMNGLKSKLFVREDELTTLVEKLTELRKPSENLVEAANKYATERWGEPSDDMTDQDCTYYDYCTEDYINGFNAANLTPFNQNAETETISKAQQLEAFQCKVCGEQFGNTSDLYDHYDKNHNHPE